MAKMDKGLRLIVCDSEQQAERVAAIMRKITGNNWKRSCLCSHLMTSDNAPVIMRFA